MLMHQHLEEVESFVSFTQQFYFTCTTIFLEKNIGHLKTDLFSGRTENHLASGCLFNKNIIKILTKNQFLKTFREK